MLVQLLYASRATHSIETSGLREILDTSRARNTEHGITGALCADLAGGHFIQVLEGGRAAVNRLYANLMADPRHTDLILLHYADIEARRFAGWRMGNIDLRRVNVSTLLRYSETARLDPSSMTGCAALALLEELMDTAAIDT